MPQCTAFLFSCTIQDKFVPLPQNSNLTMKKESILATIQLLILLSAVALFACSCSDKSEEEIYDRLQRKTDWKAIVKQNQQQPTHSLACHKVVVLAQYRLGQIPALATQECLADTREVLASPLAAMMMSDVYIQLGMVNMAQRAAFESMVKEPDLKKNERALMRLTETAIITRQYEVARKYIAILETITSHSKWVSDMRQLAEHPELIEQNAVYKQLRETYEKTKDQFFL